MKRILFIAGMYIVLQSLIACGNESSNAETDAKTHTHEDGSTHADHDTTKPAQQEFQLSDSTKTDTTKMHSHGGSKPHSH